VKYYDEAKASIAFNTILEKIKMVPQNVINWFSLQTAIPCNRSEKQAV
jgi:hypothetical protein